MSGFVFRLSVVCFWLVLSACSGQDTPAVQKVVYHINYQDTHRQASVLRSIQNHLNAVGAGHLDLRVVVHGQGLGMLRSAHDNQTMQQLVQRLKQQHVRFLVCNNSLNSQDLDYRSDLYDVHAEDLVDNGIVEIARLQALGYVYLKP